MKDENQNRPPVVLRVTVDYIKNCIIDQDCCLPGQSSYEYQYQSYGEMKVALSEATQPFQDIYSFVKDRIRQISKDISMLINMPDAQRCMYAPDIAYCYEMMIRWMIIFQHDGLSEETFDTFSNHQLLT